jgi:hypothetical protein
MKFSIAASVELLPEPVMPLTRISPSRVFQRVPVDGGQVQLVEVRYVILHPAERRVHLAA